MIVLLEMDSFDSFFAPRKSKILITVSTNSEAFVFIGIKLLFNSKQQSNFRNRQVESRQLTSPEENTFVISHRIYKQVYNLQKILL